MYIDSREVTLTDSLLEKVNMENIEKLAEDIYGYADNHRVAVACTVTTACGLLALRRWLQGGVCRSTARLNNKTVLITGANTGIGRETARDLAGRGARVILACRDLLKGERAAEHIRKTTGNNDVSVYKLDLASLKSVRQCAEQVKAKEKRLDVLINNAGVMWTPYWKTEDGFEMQFGTNHLGHFLLTNLLLDLLKSSGPSRIVNVSSLAHTRGQINFDDINSEKNYSPTKAYSQSKLANVLFTRELSKRLKGTDVSAFSLHPGAVETELVRCIDEFNIVLRVIFNILYHGLARHVIKSSAEGAQTSIHCAVEPGLESSSGKYFSKVTGSSLHPGVIKTELYRHLPLLDKEHAPEFTKGGSKWIMLVLFTLCTKTIKAGAQTTIYCAVSEDVEGVSGKYFSDCAVKVEASQAQDDEVAARLWKISKEMVGLK